MVVEEHRTKLEEIRDFELEFLDETMPFEEIKTVIKWMKGQGVIRFTLPNGLEIEFGVERTEVGDFVPDYMRINEGGYDV